MPQITRIGLENRFGGSVACKITFYNEDTVYTINQELRGPTWSGPYDEMLIDVSTNKDLNAPCGSFSITLHDRPIPSGPMKGRRLQDMLRPHDMVCISFRRGSVFLGKMIGIIGAKPLVVEDIDVNGARIRTVHVSGFDFGKFLLTTQSYYFKDVPEADPVVATIRGQSIFPQNGPFSVYGGITKRAHLFRFMIEQWLFKLSSLSWRYADQTGEGGGSFPLPSLLSWVMGETGEIPFVHHTLDEEQSLYSFMCNAAEKPWNEFFVDTWPATDAEFYNQMVPDPVASRRTETGDIEFDPDTGFRSTLGGFIDGVTPFFCLRQTPFDADKWSQLPLFEIDNEVIHRAEIGGEGDIYTLFYARPPANAGSNTSNQLAGQGVPAFDLPGLKRYGYRPLIVECQNIPNTRPDDGNNTLNDLQSMAEEWTNRLARWFYPSPEFLSGSITVQGNPLYRVGTRLRRHMPTFQYGDPFDFYLEGVTDTFSTYGQYRTHLRVTRGLRPDQDRFEGPSRLVKSADFNIMHDYWGRH